VEKLGDMGEIIKKCQQIIPPPVREDHPLPYLAPALDAGMATLFAEELIEALRYLEQPDFYTKTEGVSDRSIWLGAADDVILENAALSL
jgi:acetyl-CoA synthase